MLVRKDFESDEAFSEACYQAAEKAGAEVICLCGWLKKLAVPARWEGRILNIHPGLLPQFGGPGMYGMHVHQAVLAAGEAESGATVHLVDGEYDHGRILQQLRVPVLPGDTPEDLQKRVYAVEMDVEDHRLIIENAQRFGVSNLVTAESVAKPAQAVLFPEMEVGQGTRRNRRLIVNDDRSA